MPAPTNKFLTRLIYWNYAKCGVYTNFYLKLTRKGKPPDLSYLLVAQDFYQHLKYYDMKKSNKQAASKKPTTAPKNTPDNQDLTDSPKDQEKLQGDEATLDLPDVKDIPGQEFIHVPPPGEMADTTISSADEEGDDVLDNEDDLENNPGDDPDADISPEELRLLQESEEDVLTEDELQLRRAKLDNRDDEGDLLNEQGFGDERSGDDLDVPGSEEDDDEEAIGEEDEENNPYSVDEENEADEDERPPVNS